MVYILYLIKQASQKTQQLLISVICNSCRGSEKKGALRLLKEAACGHVVITWRQK